MDVADHAEGTEAVHVKGADAFDEAVIVAVDDDVLGLGATGQRETLEGELVVVGVAVVAICGAACGDAGDQEAVVLEQQILARIADSGRAGQCTQAGGGVVVVVRDRGLVVGHRE